MDPAKKTTDSHSTMERALFAMKDMRAKMRALENTLKEPIAIVGMGCRFPGRAKDAGSFWTVLHDGVDAVAEIPPARWDLDAYYDPDPAAAGKMYTRYGALLEEVDKFDPHFFGIAPREASRMDPQQRLLLEVTWEALENAGHAPDQLHGSRTGVFIGISTNDYVQLGTDSGDPARIDAYLTSGNALSAASGRVSYFFGFHGP